MLYLRRDTRLKIVQLVTLSRIVGAVLFAAIALRDDYRRLAIALYAYALATDFLDGWLARKLGVATDLGAAFDGVADKYITIASVLFLAALGVPLVACCLIVLRDLVVQGLRTVMVGGFYLFRPSRLLGGISGLPIRIITLGALMDQSLIQALHFTFKLGAWAVATGSISSLAYSLYRERRLIHMFLDGEAQTCEPCSDIN